MKNIWNTVFFVAITVLMLVAALMGNHLILAAYSVVLLAAPLYRFVHLQGVSVELAKQAMADLKKAQDEALEELKR